MRIHEGLERIARENLISFHMPGHKKGRLVSDSLKEIYRHDITEIPGADNLHEATGIIRASQEALRDYYGSLKAYFLVNGSTSGLYAAIMATARPSETLIVSRESHRSIYSALMLGGINARYLYPEIDPVAGACQEVTLEKVREAFERYPEAKGLVLTSPTFLGILSPVKEIAAYLHGLDKVLIVDEAHGAHLKMMGQNHQSSIFAGADLVIHSLHKTLPVLTQGSALHLNSDRIDRERLEELLNIHQTSSPSYVLMDSMDEGLRIMEEEGQTLGRALMGHIRKFEAGLQGHPCLKLMTHPWRDLTRLVLINGEKATIDFNRLESVLRKEYGIQAEYSYDKGLVLITTIANTQGDFDGLMKALWAIDFSQLLNTGEYGTIKYIRPEKNLSLREAFYRDKQWIPLSKARGYTAARMIIPYPPGIPLIAPGEIFSSDIIERIHEMAGFNYNILGIKEEDHHHWVAVVKEEN
jgi:arginine/lysine/ornithine decarboxylase